MSIFVLFRLDDPHAKSDHSIEKRILDVFKKYGSPICVAVVPFFKSKIDDAVFKANADFMPHIAEGINDEIITIAQHGHSHQNVSSIPNAPSEFFGRDKSIQKNLISEGYQQLKVGFSTPIYGFVPPWNSIDQETFKIIKDMKYSFVSGGLKFSGTTRKSGKIDNVALIPRTCTLRTLNQALEQATKYNFISTVIVCVLHPDEFEEYRTPPVLDEPLPFTSLNHLDQILSSLKKNRCVKVTSFVDLTSKIKSGIGLWHVSDKVWYKVVPGKYHYKLPLSLLFVKKHGFSRLEEINHKL